MAATAVATAVVGLEVVRVAGWETVAIPASPAEVPVVLVEGSAAAAMAAVTGLCSPYVARSRGQIQD